MLICVQENIEEHWTFKKVLRAICEGLLRKLLICKVDKDEWCHTWVGIWKFPICLYQPWEFHQDFPSHLGNFQVFKQINGKLRVTHFCTTRISLLIYSRNSGIHGFLSSYSRKSFRGGGGVRSGQKFTTHYLLHNELT